MDAAQRVTLQPFSWGKRSFGFTPGFGRSFVGHHGRLWLAAGSQHLPNVTHANRKPREKSQWFGLRVIKGLSPSTFILKAGFEAGWFITGIRYR